MELVERIIAKDMQETKGALMFYGWTIFGTHCIGLYAVYRRSIKQMVKSKIRYKIEVTCPLISPGPMNNYEMDSNGNITVGNGAVQFNVVTYIRHSEDIFHILGFSLHEWTVAQIAEHWNLNRKIAVILEKRHIGCSDHLLNLQIHISLSDSVDLGHVIESVNGVRTECLSKLKNRAMLRDICDLQPIDPIEPRWFVISDMVKRYNVIRDSILAVSQCPQSTIKMDTSIKIINQDEKSEPILSKLDNYTKVLQLKNSTLSKCGLYLDS